MGCGEGDLERKARRFGWKEAAASIALSVAVFGGVIWAHESGLDSGYAKGKSEGVAEGRQAEAEEGREASEGANFLEVGQGYIEAKLLRADGDEGSTVYNVSMYEGKIDETICVLRPKGISKCYSDTDLFYHAGAPNVHDGKVDNLSVRQGDDVTEYYRARDYNANKDLFDLGDIEFERLKQRFAMREE